MSRRILFGCDGAPVRGSVNPWAYNLFERMRGDGIDVVLVNLLNEADDFFFRYTCGDDFADPRRVGNVFNCTVADPALGEQAELSELIRTAEPDLLVAWGVVPAVLLRSAAPRLPLVLVATQSRQLEHLIEHGVVPDAIGFQSAVARAVSFDPEPNDPETVVRQCDLLIVTSSATRLAFEHFYRNQVGKIYARTLSPRDLVDEEAAPFAELRRSFPERDVDVLFADVDWRPRSRNLDLARRIASRLEGLRVYVAGEHDAGVPRAHSLGLPGRRRDLYALLGRTKVLACPALSDVGPGLFFEASAMRCNVVASVNSGHADLCNEELRVPGRRESDFVERIRRAVARPFEDNRAAFCADAADLADTLTAL